jgi:hypothetical protein
MFFKEYLSIENANQYCIQKTGYGLSVSDLQQLEREGKITPLLYLDVNLISQKLPEGTLYSFDLPDNKHIHRVRGYFKAKGFFLLDCYEYCGNPYYSTSEEIEVLYFKNGLETFEVVQTVMPTESSFIGSVGYIFHCNIKDENGFYETIEALELNNVLIRKSELDSLINHQPEQGNDALKQRIAELEQQLDEQQQAPQRARAQTDETNTDKKLIAMLAILLAKQSNTFRIGQKPNYKQINKAVNELALDLQVDNEDMRGLQANADKISKAVQAYADMFKLSKD